MSTKPILIICAIVVAVFGFSYLVFPSLTISLLGFVTDSTGLLVTQFIGILSIGYAVILWKLRAADLEEQKPILLGITVSMGLAFLVSLLHQLSGSFGNLGWAGVSMFGSASILFGYFYVRR